MQSLGIDLSPVVETKISDDVSIGNNYTGNNGVDLCLDSSSLNCFIVVDQRGGGFGRDRQNEGPDRTEGNWRSGPPPDTGNHSLSD